MYTDETGAITKSSRDSYQLPGEKWVLRFLH